MTSSITCIIKTSTKSILLFWTTGYPSLPRQYLTGLWPLFAGDHLSLWLLLGPPKVLQSLHGKLFNWIVEHSNIRKVLLLIDDYTIRTISGGCYPPWGVTLTFERILQERERGFQKTLPKPSPGISLNTTSKVKSKPTGNNANNNTILLLASGGYCGRL